MQKKKNIQARKWQITINNPLDKGYTHEQIKAKLEKISSCVYWAMADEMGHTHHTHLYIACSSAVRFSTIKNRFSGGHFEVARGTSQQNRDYIAKEGKWEKNVKHGSQLPGTFEEAGEMPLERPGARSDLEVLYDMIRDGLTDGEILERDPSYIQQIERLERVRQAIKSDEFKNKRRDLMVVYISGPTGCGKTRGVLEKYGYENVFRTTSYGNGCFDGYKAQSVIAFEEFRSNRKLTEMLTWLDPYPVELPARYSNRTAMFDTAFIVSNIPLEAQYTWEQTYEKESWQAFLRRIHYVVVYDKPSEYTVFNVGDYMNRDSPW